MKQYNFKKEERLCNKRLINVLYESGSSFILYPYKVTFLPCDELNVPIQVLFSVPKRRFKKAVDRNLLKRRMRESYRLHKGAQLYPFFKGQPILLSIQYIGKNIESYHFINEKMSKLFRKLQDEFSNIHME